MLTKGSDCSLRGNRCQVRLDQALKSLSLYHACNDDLDIFIKILLSIKALTNPFLGAVRGGAGVDGGAPPPDILKTGKEK